MLRAGRQVYIYPEGTRRAPGAEPAYKFGVAHLYEQTGAPCLPVALNTGVFWGRRGFLRRPGVAVIEFLPVDPAGAAARRVLRAAAKRHRDRRRNRLIAEARAARPALDPSAAAA